MADIEFRIREVGADNVANSLQKIADAAQKADKAIDNLGKETDKTDKELHELVKALITAVDGLKKVEKEEDAATKKMGLLEKAAASVGPAIAAVVSSAVLRQFNEWGKEGGALNAVSARLEEIGITAENTSDIINRLGGGSISSTEKLISGASQAGLAFEQMQQIAQVAGAVAAETGEDAQQAFAALAKAVGTGKTAYLKQLDIVVDAKEAQLEYAESVGRSVKELSAQEKQLAVQQAAIKALNETFEGRSVSAYAANLGTVSDIISNIGDGVKRFAGDALSTLGGTISRLQQGYGIIEAIRGGVSDLTTEEQKAQKEATDLAIIFAELENIEIINPAQARRIIRDLDDIGIKIKGVDADANALDSLRRNKSLIIQEVIGKAGEAEDILAKAEIKRTKAEEARTKRAVEAAKKIAGLVANESAGAAAAAKAAADQKAAREKEIDLIQKEKDALADLELAAVGINLGDRPATPKSDEEIKAREEAARASNKAIENERIAHFQRLAKIAYDGEIKAAQKAREAAVFETQDLIDTEFSLREKALIDAAATEIQINKDRADKIEEIEAKLQEDLAALREEKAEEEKEAFKRRIENLANISSNAFSAATSGAEAGFEIINQGLEKEKETADQALVTAEATTKKAEAQGKTSKAYKDALKAEEKAEENALKAARALEKEQRRQAKILAGFKSAQNFAQAAEEVAKAAGSYPQVAGIVAHSLAAAQHVAAGIKWAATAAGSGGASVSPARSAGSSTAQDAERRGADLERQREERDRRRREATSLVGGGIQVNYVELELRGDAGQIFRRVSDTPSEENARGRSVINP